MSQSEWMTVWIQIRTEVVSALIWVKTLRKGYQQTTKVSASKERVHCQSKMKTQPIFFCFNIRLIFTCVPDQTAPNVEV